MADPLDFFAADGSSSESDEEDDSNQKAQQKEESVPAEDGAEKLPSPNTLFESVGRPSFLNNPNEKFINWERFVKSSESEAASVHDNGEYAAIPPPSSLKDSGPVTTKLTRTILASGGEGVVEYSSPPVPYDGTSAGATECVSVGTDSQEQQQGVKRQLPARPQSPEAPNSKRSKGEQFRVKEKRKRDIGQSSRGKSYVEEEKRILRQQFASDAILS